MSMHKTMNGLKRTITPNGIAYSPPHPAAQPVAEPGRDKQIDPLAEEIATLLCNKITTFMSAARSALADQLGLTTVEIKALELIRELDPLPTGQLGQLLGISSGGTTALINRLETAGFIERTRHPLDRRAIVLRAVPERLRDLDSGLDCLVQEIAFVSRQFDAQQLRVVHAFLDQSARAFRHDTCTRLQSSGRLLSLAN